MAPACSPALSLLWSVMPPPLPRRLPAVAILENVGLIAKAKPKQAAADGQQAANGTSA